jgi:WD40 repeat protein/3',5'-cyclic AMP phosphodiesterase CpdA
MSLVAGRNSIAILHLSDLQFGRNHRFGRLGLAPPDDQFDTLFARLRDDLEYLRDKQQLVPELVIVTGDIAEWGKAKEFDDALLLIEQLRQFLGLSRRRIVAVPGNHDINRRSCEAYFADREADDEKPLAPYWPKWKQYSAFFDKLYEDERDISFTPDQPWTLFSINDLKLVVAGLNSTMRESHLDDSHYGHVGEAQLRWFAERLDQVRREGWLRIGTVHHNVERACHNDDENLRDADDLKRHLGSSLNLCLHGHTHESGLAWISPKVPVLSTGSAAVDANARSEEVPNQYQVIQISALGFKRWTRGFDPRQKKWIADTRGSEKGDEWITEHSVAFADVGGTFDTDRRQLPRKKLGSKHEPGLARVLDESARSDDFLSRVEEVLKHRSPNATVTAVRHSDSHLHYLRVAELSAAFVRQYPVGVFEHGLKREDLDRFLELVDAPYRASDSGLISEIVYGGGELPAPDVVDEAKRRRVRVSSFVEYQGIIDFRAYVRKQTAKLERDEIYPPSLYVAQRMRFAIGTDEIQTDHALAQVQEWIASPDPRFVLILGDFGTGKTFLLHELARRLGSDDRGLTPVLVDLRALEKARTLDTLIAQHLADAGMERIDLAAFRYMLQQGRIVLLFDGFDELALRVSYERAADHFETILQATGGDAKVLLTSRTTHFESEKQVRTILYERAQPVPGLRYCKLLPFTEPQIRQFLVNRWKDPAEADEWLELLHDVKDLLGLSENPRMLGFIMELKKDDLRKAKMKEGVISAAELYRLLLERWLIFEYERAHPRGVQEALSREARWAAVMAIANRLWKKTEKYLTQPELVEETSAALRPLMTNPPEAGIAAHLIGSGSLLRRDDEGCFFLVHQSVMEWLVARQASEDVRTKGDSPALQAAAMSQLMTDFFCDLATADVARHWAMEIVERSAAGFGKSNALDVLKRLGGEVSLSLAGQDLRGRDFAELQLRGANLAGADLTEARLAGKDFTGANLDGARLVRADLTRAILKSVSLQNTDLSEARLLGADLRDANLSGSVLRRAKLVGAQVDAHALDQVDTWGAALPEVTGADLLFSYSSRCFTVAWSPDGNLLATGHQDNAIRIWDVISGQEICQFLGHQSLVAGLAFSPDGKLLASGSYDGTVRLWETATGNVLHEFTEHNDFVRAVAFSGDGRRLASGGDDRTVRLWDVLTKQELRQFKGHSQFVSSIALSPDGNRVASAGDGDRIRLWDATTGQEIRQLVTQLANVQFLALSTDGEWVAIASNRVDAGHSIEIWNLATGEQISRMTGHELGVWGISFSPDRKWLASGGGDMTVRLWDAATGEQLRLWGSHRDSVRSVAFSPDGKWLASGGDEVGLWDAASGQESRTFFGHRSSVDAVVFDSTGKWLATTGVNGTVSWDIATGRLLQRLRRPPQRLLSVAISPDGESFADGGFDGAVRLWDVTTGGLIRQFDGHEDFVRSITFGPNGKWLASGGDDDAMRLWEVASGRLLRRFDGHQDWIRGVAFSPDGRWLASASDDGTVRIWDRANGRQVQELNEAGNYVMSVAFSPDGKWLASAGGDRTVRLWNRATGRELRRFIGHQDSVVSVAFSPDGKQLASGSHDDTARLWETATGRLLQQLTDHHGSVASVAFSPDGRWLASGSFDNTLHLRDAATGESKLILLHLEEGWAAFTPDGRYKHGGNLSGGLWFAINLCRFEPGELDAFLPTIRQIPLEEPF